MVLILGCSKESLTTRPKVTVNSVSPNPIVAADGTLNIELEFFDKQGDLGNKDSTLYCKINRLNIIQPAPNAGAANTEFYFKLPDFPNTSNGFIDLTFDYSQLDRWGTRGGINYPDTFTLKFVLRDHAGNKSDTATSGIVIAK